MFDPGEYQVKIKTPTGEAQWACLAKPKKWTDDDKGKYQISLILNKEEAEAIINTCTAIKEKIADIIQKDDRPVKLSPYDPWKEMEDGRIELRFKKPHYPAGDKYPESRPVTTYMPDGTKVDWSTVDWAVGNGSIVQIAGYARPYYVGTLGLGITLKLDKVKIHELQEYTSGEGDDYGFSAPVDSEFSSGEVGQPEADF